MVDDALARGGDDQHGWALRPVVRFFPQACRRGLGER